MLEFSRKVGILGESWQAMFSFFLKLARKDRDIPFLQVSASPATKETDIKNSLFSDKRISCTRRTFTSLPGSAAIYSRYIFLVVENL